MEGGRGHTASCAQLPDHQDLGSSVRSPTCPLGPPAHYNLAHQTHQPAAPSSRTTALCSRRGAIHKTGFWAGSGQASEVPGHTGARAELLARNVSREAFSAEDSSVSLFLESETVTCSAQAF